MKFLKKRSCRILPNCGIGGFDQYFKTIRNTKMPYFSQHYRVNRVNTRSKWNWNIECLISQMSIKLLSSNEEN